MDGQAVLVGKIEASDPSGRFTNHEVSLLGLDGIIDHLAGSSDDSGKAKGSDRAMPTMAKAPKMVKSTSMEGLSGMGRARARTLTPDLGMDGGSGRQQPSLEELNQLINKAKADKAARGTAGAGAAGDTGSSEPGAAADSNSNSKGGAAAGKQSGNITFMQMLKKEVEGRRAKPKDRGWGDLEDDPMSHTVYGVAMHQQTIHGGERGGGKGGD